MAVYTHLTDDEIADFLSAYPVGRLIKCEPVLEGAAHTIYHLTTMEDQYILRLYEPITDPQTIPFAINFMQHLSENGIPCPLPIRNHQGAYIGTIRRKPATLISFLPGHSPDPIAPDHAFQVGQTLGRLHRFGEGFKQHLENPFGQARWQDWFGAVEDYIDGIQAGLASVMREELEYLQENWPSHLPTGAIHADLSWDNVLFEGKTITGVLDFDFACTDLLALDLCITLNFWGFRRRKAPDRALMGSLIRGYETVRHITPEEKQVFPFMMRAAAMRFLSSRVHDHLKMPPDALIVPRDPHEYITILQHHRTVSDFSAYTI